MRNPHQLRNQHTSDGFTLIELLLVIVVIGIIASIVVFEIGNVTTKAYVADCQSDGETIYVGIADFNTENGTWPTSQAEMTAINPLNGSPYIQTWPTGNSSHYTFTLSTSPANGTFVLKTPADPTGVVWTGSATCSDPALAIN